LTDDDAVQANDDPKGLETLKDFVGKKGAVLLEMP